MWPLSGQSIRDCGFSPSILISTLLSLIKITEVLVAQLCATLCDPLDCSPPGSSAHGILQARTLEWVAILFSRGIFLTQG